VQNFQHFSKTIVNDIHFITQPCFGLVELVEHGDLESPALIALLKKYIDPLLKEKIDTLVLGCTHYSFFKARNSNINTRPY
jgi:glutamate racemase